jgi:type IV pilus assembly protein PilF
VKKTVFGKLGAVFLTAALLSGGSGMVHAADPSGGQTNAEKSASIHLQLAIEFYKQQNYKSALQEIKRSLDALPDYAAAYSMGGLIYMETGDMQSAGQSFQKAMKIDPDNGDFINNYGWFLCQNDRVQESIAYFEHAVSLRTYTTPGKAYDNAGMCSLKLKDNNAAEKYFAMAFKVDPGNPRVNYNLAILNYEHRDYEQAKFHIAKTIKTGITPPEVLWLGIKIAHKMSDSFVEGDYAAMLQRLHPNSKEYMDYRREAYDE